MWKAVQYEDKQLDLLINMARENYGDIEIADKSFIVHQYFHNPIGNAIISLAIDENGFLAGQYSVCPMRVKVFEKESTCVLSLNTLTRKSYRGQGIFTKLAEFTYDRINNSAIFCYGMPNQNSYKGFISKLSFETIGNVPLFLKPIKPSKIIKELTGYKSMSIVARPFDCLSTHFHKGNCNEKYELIKITEENLSFIDEFWNKINQKYPVMFVRDSKYISWRYLEIPLREYDLYMVLDNGEPIAFAAGRIMKVSNISCGMIVDFIISPEAEEAGMLLIKHLQNEFSERGVSLMGCLMQKHTQEAKLLKKSNFFICPKNFEPQPFPIILRLFDKKLETPGIKNFSNWFFTMGDYDVV